MLCFRLPVWLCMLGHETHVCNIMLCRALRSLSINTLSHRVLLWCHVVSTHIVHIVCMFEMHWYVWDSTPSRVPLVAFHTGKCLLVLPLSLGSSLLLRNTWIDRHVSFFAPVSIPTGKCHVVFTEILVACYDLVTLTADRHMHCWVMYACPCTFEPPWFMTSHVDPGSLPYGC